MPNGKNTHKKLTLARWSDQFETYEEYLKHMEDVKMPKPSAKEKKSLYTDEDK